MRIVFFGTGEFSATILNGLLDAGRDVVAVVSQIDKVNARNNKIIYSPVKKICLEKGIKLFQYAKLNLEGETDLKALSPDLFITASYGQIIKQNILDIPKIATVNVHASLLPKYRGPAPIEGAIIGGEKKTGITIMRTELGMDTGDMFLQKEIPIEKDDTASSVFKKLATLGVDCINEFLDNINYYLQHGEKQDETKASYFPMIKKESFLLNFDDLSINLFNKIIALENCYFVHKKVRYKVLFAVENEKTGKVGEVLCADGKNGLIIGTRDKSIEVITIQPEGKQKMFALSFMNSGKFKVGEIIDNT